MCILFSNNIADSAKKFWKIFFFFSEFTWKRCAFRTLTVGILLFIGESVPSFGSILDLVGGSTVTCKSIFFDMFMFVFLTWESKFSLFRFNICLASPTLYLVDGSIWDKVNYVKYLMRPLHLPFTYFFISRKLNMMERVYCWFLILLGLFGGFSSTFTAIKNIIQTPLSSPCYIS